MVVGIYPALIGNPSVGKSGVKANENLPICYKGTVFLSYNNPDLDVAKKLKKLLQAEGIRSIWFDKDNLGAGEHEILIKKEIRSCKVFIPLISNHSLSASADSFVKKVEWESIKIRFNYNELNRDEIEEGDRFQLIPVVLDNTDRSDSRIPAFMQKFSMWNYPQDRERIVEVIQNALISFKRDNRSV